MLTASVVSNVTVFLEIYNEWFESGTISFCGQTIYGRPRSKVANLYMNSKTYARYTTQTPQWINLHWTSMFMVSSIEPTSPSYNMLIALHVYVPELFLLIALKLSSVYWSVRPSGYNHVMFADGLASTEQFAVKSYPSMTKPSFSAYTSIEGGSANTIMK